MHKFVLLALIFALPVRAADVVDGVAAIVNDKVITYSEVREYVQPVVQQLRRQFSGNELIEKVRAAQMDALNNLIQRALIIQEFRSKEYKLPETVVDSEINDIITQEFGGDRTAFVRTLQAQNMTLARYREQIEERFIVQAMLAHKTQQNVVVSPFRIEKYYKEHLDDYKLDDQIKLRMIFLSRSAPPATPASTNAPATEVTGTNEVAATGETNVAATAPAPPPVDPHRLLADEILAKLEAGAKFEDLAKEFSEGKESKQGGDWGWVSRDSLRKEINAVAFALKAGQHSQVIETEQGYYLLQVDDVKPAHTRPLAEVRDEIEKTLLADQRTKMQDDWVKELRRKAYIRLF